MPCICRCIQRSLRGRSARGGMGRGPDFAGDRDPDSASSTSVPSVPAPRSGCAIRIPPTRASKRDRSGKLHESNCHSMMQTPTPAISCGSPRAGSGRPRRGWPRRARRRTRRRPRASQAHPGEPLGCPWPGVPLRAPVTQHGPEAARPTRGGQRADREHLSDFTSAAWTLRTWRLSTYAPFWPCWMRRASPRLDVGCI